MPLLVFWSFEFCIIYIFLVLFLSCEVLTYNWFFSDCFLYILYIQVTIKLHATLVAQSKKICLQCGRLGFDPWDGKIPWRMTWQPTPVFLPGGYHGQKSLVGSTKSMGSQRVGHDWVTKHSIAQPLNYLLYALLIRYPDLVQKFFFYARLIYLVLTFAMCSCQT